MSPSTRFFSAGTRQTPDPYDQYLEKEGFYRKHTARDSTCLFRVISEQVYDTQLHHLFVRENCVKFMANNRSLFEYDIQSDYDEYLKELKKPTTFGSLVELKALAFYYKYNVVLFGAFNTGVWFVKMENFTDCFRIFFTPQKHFDSIYTIDYIEVLGFTQGILYELLYDRVFGLPDIMYAVERMLYDPCQITMEYIYSDEYNDNIPAGISVTTDGRKFIFDNPEKTACILDNYELCHFHNKDFAFFASKLNKDYRRCKNEIEKNHFTRIISSLLTEKYISCVRQLLDMGITPFPYKVAKGIDPYMYRNIEFDVWNDARKANIINKTNLKVGAKCLVRLYSSNSSLYNCHIQEISTDCDCVVYIEELGEKRMVSLDQLKLKKPCQLRVSYQKKISPKRYDSAGHTNGLNKNLVQKFSDNQCNQKCCLEEYESDKYDYSFLNSIKNITVPSYEVIAMPMIKENIYKKSKDNDNNESNKRVNDKNNNKMNKDDKNEKDESHSSEIFSNNSSGYGYLNQGMTALPFDPNIPPPPVTPVAMANSGRHFYIPSPYNSMHSSSSVQTPYVGNVNYNPVNSSMPYIIPISRRDLLTSNQPINYSICPSYAPNGCDIPMNDIISVRFFYNLGHEYFKFINMHYGMHGIFYLTQTEPSISPNDSVNNTRIDSEIKTLSNELETNCKIDNEGTPTQSSMKKYSGRPSNQNHNYNSNKKDKSYNYRNNNNNQNKNTKATPVKKDTSNVSSGTFSMANHSQQSLNRTDANVNADTVPTVANTAERPLTGSPFVQMPQYSQIAYPPYMQYSYPADGNDTYPMYQPYFSAPFGVTTIPSNYPVQPTQATEYASVNPYENINPIESPYSGYSTLYYPPIYPSQRPAAANYPTYYYLSAIPQPYITSPSVMPNAMPHGLTNSFSSASESL